MSLVPGSALVTGGGPGIGRAIALALVGAGTPVSVVDLLPDGGKTVVDEIVACGGTARFITADVSRWDGVDRAVGETVRTLRTLGPPSW